MGKRRHAVGDEARRFVLAHGEPALHEHQRVRLKERTVFFVGFREDERLGGAVKVLQRDEGHHVALAGGLGLDLGHNAAHHGARAVHRKPLVLGFLAEQGQRAGVYVQLIQFLAVFVQRMAGDIHAGHLLFEREQRAGGQFGQIGQRRGGHGERLVAQRVEERQLPLDNVLAPPGRAVHDRLVDRELLRAVAGQRIERARLDERFHDALCERFGGHAVYKLVDIAESAALFDLLRNREYRRVADVLDGVEAEAHGALSILAIDGELFTALVHVRRQHGDALLAQILDIEGHLDRIARDGVHHRGHEFGGMVQLEPRGLERDHGVARGVRLVEGVAGEGGHLFEELLGDFLRHAVAHSAGHGDGAVGLHLAVDEDFLLLRHHVVLFLGHGAAHEVAAAHGIAGQIAHDLHDLLLIDHAAVGHVQDRLELGMQIFDRLGLLLAGDEARNGLHRAGAIERYGGDDVLKAGGLHVGQERAHTAAFHLEDAVGIALGDHVEHALVVHGNVLGGHARPAALLDHGQRVADDGERAQPQKVHLEQAEVLQRVLGELRRDHAVVGLQRHIFVHGPAGDQHARGVGRGVARHPLELARRIDELLHALVVVVGRLELRIDGERLVERHVQREGNHLGHSVGFGVAHVQHAAHVPHDRLGGHCAEGDDLRDVIRAVAPGDVIDHLAAPLVVEVDVQIGHGDALRVQEALEEQVVFERIDGGDVQAVAGQRAGAAAASGADEDAVFLGEVHIVPDDEEVVHIAHALDDRQLVIEPLARVLPVGGVMALEALLAERTQIILGRRALGQRKARQVRRLEIEFHMAALGDFDGVLERLGEIRKDLAHFRLGFDEHLVALHAHPLFVAQRLAGLYAHEHFLRLSVLTVYVVAVVRGDEGDVHLPRQIDQAGQHALLVLKAVILNFNEEIAAPEYVEVFLRHGARVVLAAVQQQRGNVA